MTLLRVATAAAALPAALLTLAPRALAAGEQTPLNLERVEPVRTAGSGGGGLVRTLVGLAVVIAVIYGVYWLLRQIKASREERASGDGLSLAATVPLGPSRALHLVRAGSDLVLVGSGEHGITPIRTYSEREAREAGLLDPPDEDGVGGLAGLEADMTGALAASEGRARKGAAARPAGRPTARELVEALRRRTVRR